VIYGSVCSGIEAASVAWHPMGWRAAFLSEIEAFPRAVLHHHYPEVPLHGDFTTIRAGEYEPIDLLVGGTPCQSFSVAGLRGGLDDDRGNLALEYLRLADRLRPRWLVWENVPGVLSSNRGRDFGAILGGMVELGYGVAYRVLDAQFFGVAQRRRRVFVVGYLGDWRRAAAVLFERHSLSGHPAPRREAGERPAPTVARGSPAGGRSYGLDADTADSLQVECFGGGNTHGPVPVAAALAAHGRRQDFEVETFVAHTLKGEGFDASEDGTGRRTPIVSVAFRTTGNDGAYETGDQIGALTTSTDPNAQIIAFSAKDHGADAMSDLSPTLRAGGHAGSHANVGVMPAVAFAIQERAVSENSSSGPGGAGFRSDDAAYTLEARTVPQSVAFALRGREGGAMPEIEGDGNRIGALRAASGGSSRDYVASSAVRRLTPRECERLQGFPDDYTLIPYRGKLAADGPRYKALGNSMAVPVMRWIGERIAQVDAIPHSQNEKVAA